MGVPCKSLTPAFCPQVGPRPWLSADSSPILDLTLSYPLPFLSSPQPPSRALPHEKNRECPGLLGRLDVLSEHLGLRSQSALTD